MTADDGPVRVVRVRVENVSAREIDVVLEPLGEVYALSAGASRCVRLSVDATTPVDAPLELTISVDADEIKLWEEGTGHLEIEPDAP